jgi:hypothetical protein
VFYAAALTGWNRRIFLLKLFNISIPVAKELLKHTSARTVHAKVIVKPARVVKFEFLSERFGEKLTGDPNAPAGVLGPPIPPLYSCQNLRIVCKKAGLIRRFPSVLDRFSSKQFPPSSQQEAHSIEGTDPCLKKSVQKCKTSNINPCF